MKIAQRLIKKVSEDALGHDPASLTNQKMHLRSVVQDCSDTSPQKFSLVVIMQLRDHPLMRRHGATNWPPIWTQGMRGEGKKTIRGEVGILSYIHAPDKPSTKCYLVIAYEGQYYVGSLLFDDVTFCGQITNLLRQQIGRTIREIGDLDLTYAL